MVLLVMEMIKSLYLQQHVSIINGMTSELELTHTTDDGL